VRGQLHVCVCFTALTLRKELLIPIGYKVGCAPQPVW